MADFALLTSFPLRMDSVASSRTARSAAALQEAQAREQALQAEVEQLACQLQAAGAQLEVQARQAQESMAQLQASSAASACTTSRALQACCSHLCCTADDCSAKTGMSFVVCRQHMKRHSCKLQLVWSSSSTGTHSWRRLQHRAAGLLCSSISSCRQLRLSMQML